MWFNAIGSTTNHEGAVITSFHSWYGKAAWPFLTDSFTGRQPYSFPLFHFPFLYASCLAKFILNSLPSFSGRKYSKTSPACLVYKFCRLQTQLTRSNGGHLENIEYKYPAHSLNIHSLAAVNYLLPRGETLFHLPPINNLEIFKDFSSITRK